MLLAKRIHIQVKPSTPSKAPYGKAIEWL